MLTWFSNRHDCGLRLQMDTHIEQTGTGIGFKYTAHVLHGIDLFLSKPFLLCSTLLYVFLVNTCLMYVSLKKKVLSIAAS